MPHARRSAAPLGMLFATLLVLPAPGGARAADEAERAQSRIKQGYAIAPVPLKVKRRNRADVGLGSYIVNAQGGCNDCHTNPPYASGGDPFLGQPEQINVEGYLAGGQQFGPFTSRNLTPDENGHPAGLTFQQFKAVMRTGHDPKQVHPEISPLLQVMPWPVYSKMVTSDLWAIYQYLSAIPSVDHEH